MKVSDCLVGVVGSGTMGSGIAQKYAAEGFSVILVDKSQESLDRGMGAIAKTLDSGVKRKLFTEDKKTKILGRISPSTELAALETCNLIVEAIFEDEKVKKQLYVELEAICPKETLIATNTSGFLVSCLAEDFQYPERFLGLHYFFHPAMNKLVEVIKGEKTSNETFQTAFDIQEASGKIAIESKDAPGFIVNRFFVPWLNESLRLVESGAVNIATVDWAAKRAFGIGMGPFKLMNVTGVAITMHAANALAKELGDFYLPSNLVTQQVQKGEDWDLSGDVDETMYETVRTRLLEVVSSITRTLVFEENVTSPENCDLAARVALRWPKGPFELLNETLDKQSQVPLPKLKLEKKKGLGIITLNRPDTLNAIDVEFLNELDSVFASLERDPEVGAIVLQGCKKAFAAGANLSFFESHLNAGHIDPILAFANKGQALFRKIETSQKPVLALVRGLALGGGLELALACDAIYISNDAKVGFPETGIGIHPGFGGTQRTPRRIGPELAKWIIFTGETLNGNSAKSLGLADLVFDSDASNESVYELWRKNADKKSLQAVTSLNHADFADLKKTFAAPLLVLKECLSLTGIPAPVQNALKKLTHKAPVALARAETLINLASEQIETGLKAESEALKIIFRTKDAKEGIGAAGKRKPVFIGL